MSCPECGAPFVSRYGPVKTLVGYLSPPGHDHDDNCLQYFYTCSNGHETAMSLRRRCPAPNCDWVGKADCFCHPGSKVDEWPALENNT